MSKDKQQPAKKNWFGCGPITGAIVFLVIMAMAFAPKQPKSDQTKAASEPQVETRFTDDISMKLYAETVVKERLRDPGSAKFSDMRVYWAEVGKSATVCGYVNSKNGFGGMSGKKAFVASSMVIIQGDLQPAEFQEVWSTMCISSPTATDG